MPIKVEATTRDGELRISVSNAGEPIPHETMQRLFQPFQRGRPRSSPQGLGLGLYIASQIAQAHRGTLSVTSDVDGLTKVVKRALRRRAAVEPVIGHLKNDHRMGRNFLAFSEGDANNAVLAAVGYNFSLLLNWLRLLCAVLLALFATPAAPPIQPRTA
ncbi:hypothetical protein BQ8482_340178 [Mesorhizobium delmotii]|uniref:histidine kinase n=1 Tax=Mesorhizobium delmotii TaxID=1631247 RepID=A0A2P9AQC5_9HYPH|nr:hypothetical protein BQ8482_340178 [Mesorhizobium delmotii]